MNYIYFNVPPSISAGFEHDYWSLSARPALDAIFAQDPRATMSVYATNSIVFVNAKIFYPAREVRQEFDPMIADYIIDASNDQAFTSRLTPDQLIATITAGSLPVARVYRVR
jgi:hypothetical protein